MLNLFFRNNKKLHSRVLRVCPLHSKIPNYKTIERTIGNDFPDFSLDESIIYTMQYEEYKETK